jgi:chromosome transmission fidelity protein 1
MDDKERARKGELSTTAATTSSSSLPDWVAEQIVDRRRRELEEADAAYEERLEKARKKEATLRRAVAKARKRSVSRKWCSDFPFGSPEDQKPQLNDADSDDDHYLPEDDSATNEEDNISPAVRALMAKWGFPILRFRTLAHNHA